MASHFVGYVSVNAPTPIACSDDGTSVDRMMRERNPRGYVVRLLTGTCPICGSLISTLRADHDGGMIQ